MNSNLTNLINDFSYQLTKQISEFKDLQLAISELKKTPRSFELFTEINERKRTIALLDSQNLPISQDQEDELTSLMAKMREDKVIMNYLRCKNLARKKAIEIGNLLESNIGVDFSPGKICK